MSDLGEGVAVTTIAVDKDSEFNYFQLQVSYPNGEPYFVEDDLCVMTSIDGEEKPGQLNFESVVNYTLLDPSCKVEYNIEPKIDDELSQTRQEIKAQLDLIIQKEREEQEQLDSLLESESKPMQLLIMTGAFLTGAGESAMGLIEFAGDAVVFSAKSTWYSAQVTVVNNLEAAWETSYSNGDIGDFYDSVSEKAVEDFATAFGTTPKAIAQGITEAYEIMAFVMEDGETKELLLQFAKDYVLAQSKTELAKMGGSAVFDIILNAVLAVTTGGAGNAAAAAAKVRHMGYFNKLALILRKFLRQARRKKAKKAVPGKANSRHTVTVEAPKKQKLEPTKVEKRGKAGQSDTQNDRPDAEKRKAEETDKYDADAQDDSNGGSSKSEDGKSNPEDNKQSGTNEEGQVCSKDSRTCKDGEPISLVTGEEILTLQDFELPGPMPLAWNRTYKSSSSKNKGLGFGWTHSFNESIELRDGVLNYYTNEARIIPFSIPAIGATARNTAEKLQVTRTREGQFILANMDSVASEKKIFERYPGQSVFLLGSIRDAYQNGFQFIYRGSVLQQIEASYGDLWQLEYNHQRTLSAIHKLDSEGNAKTLVRYEYDELNDLVKAVDANDNAELYAYHNHLIVRRTLKSGHSFYFKWDGNDHSARCIENYGDPIEGVDTYHYRFDWDKDARKVAITDTRGGVKVYQFNDRGLPTYYRDPEGGETHTRYDELGNVIAVKAPNGHLEKFTYDREQRLIIFANAQGNKYELARDAAGQVTRIYDPLGQRWSRKYDAWGALVEQSNPLGETVKYQYNQLGLVSAISNPEGQTWHYLWDHKGQLTAIRDPKGRHTRYSYNQDALVSKITYPNGLSTHYEYDAAGNCVAIKGSDGKIQRYEYNELGLVTSITDPQGRCTRYFYNGLSQVVRKIDPQGHVLRYHYDGERNLVGLTNQNGEHYRISYDLNERIVQEVGFDGRVQRYQYDAEGFLVGQGDFTRDGESCLNRLAFKRDAVGRLLQQYQITSSSNVLLNEFAYDAAGRMTAARNAHRRLDWSFDAAGRVVKEGQDGHVTEHHYQQGKLSHRVLPDGSKVQYQFDEIGNFQSVSLNDKLVAQIERDDLGRELRRNLGNQLSTEYRYDPQGRLIAQRTGKSNGSQGFQSVSLRRLKYNDQGLLSQIEDQLRGRTRYHYDQLDRLTQVDGPSPERFIHDPAGNILASQTPDALHAPGTVAGNRLNFHGDQHFEYDDLGNRIQMHRGKNQQQSLQYQYNALNQLVKTNNRGTITEYAYDPLGRRVYKQQEAARTDFLWLGDVLLSEQKSTEQTQTNKTYLFEPGTFQPLAFVENNHVYHYHLDHLGTPQEITDAQGNLVWAVSYKAYGNLAVAFKNEVENNIRFQGQYYDQETGLHYNRFRYYDPECGRFVNQDPIGLAGGMNNYLYVPNPVGWVDPFGLTAKDCGSGAGLTGSNWKFNKEKDVDLRGTDSTYKDALEEAFNRTGVSKDEFTITKWGKDQNGKSIPVEYSGPNGANVNMDIPEFNNVKSNGALGEGPHQPHIGYQTAGKGSSRIRGHIFVDTIPATRD